MLASVLISVLIRQITGSCVPRTFIHKESKMDSTCRIENFVKNPGFFIPSPFLPITSHYKNYCTTSEIPSFSMPIVINVLYCRQLRHPVGKETVKFICTKLDAETYPVKNQQLMITYQKLQHEHKQSFRPIDSSTFPSGMPASSVLKSLLKLRLSNKPQIDHLSILLPLNF